MFEVDKIRWLYRSIFHVKMPFQIGVYNRDKVCSPTCLFAITVISFPTVFSHHVVISRLSVHSAEHSWWLMVRTHAQVNSITSHLNLPPKDCDVLSNSKHPRRHISKERASERERHSGSQREWAPLAAPLGKIPDHNNLVYVYPACKIEGRPKKMDWLISVVYWLSPSEDEVTGGTGMRPTGSD